MKTSCLETHCHLKRITIRGYAEIKSIGEERTFAHMHLIFHPAVDRLTIPDQIELFFQDVEYARKLRTAIDSLNQEETPS